MIATMTQIKETAIATAILTLLSPSDETGETVGGPMFTVMFVLTATLEDPPVTIVY